MINLKNIKNILLFLTMFFVIGLISCTKKTDEVSNKDNNVNITESVKINEDDFSESDEDLLTVDYKEFYDELAPHGEWIEVTDKDVDLQLKKGSASGEKEHRKITLSDLFGVEDAYADDVSFGAFFVWKPAPNLAVTVVAGEPEPPYVPYTNGQWVNTDAGWYFKAATPYEEVSHHYGRWVYSPALGWLWVPGRVWSPAWVDWRENDDYIAWTPIPPSVYIINNVIIVPPIAVERYVIVQNRYFCEPGVYKYMYKENKNKIMIKEWRRIDGVTVMNKTVINKGPDIKVIEKVSGKHFESYKVNKVKNIKDVKYSDKEMNVFSPEFKKYKTKGKNVSSPVVKPQKFVSYDEGKSKNEGKESPGNEKKTEDASEKDKGTGKDKKSNENNDKGKGNEKNNENKNKGNDYKQKENKKLGDDSNMKDGGKNKNKVNDNKNKGNDNKSKGNENKDNDGKSKDNNKSKGKNK